MKKIKRAITHLLIDTTGANNDFGVNCSFCLVPVMAPGYLSYLLAYMEEAKRLHRADESVYGIECWDGSPKYLRFNDGARETLRDIEGNIVADIPRGEPILLAADPQFAPENFQRVECQTVQVSKDDVWWSAYVKDTNVRIESSPVEKKTLLRIQRTLGCLDEPLGRGAVNSAHPAIRGH